MNRKRLKKKISTCLLPKNGPRDCGKPLSSSSTVCALKIACINLKPQEKKPGLVTLQT